MASFLFSVIYDVDRPFYFRPVSKVFITAFPFFNRAKMDVELFLTDFVEVTLAQFILCGGEWGFNCALRGAWVLILRSFFYCVELPTTSKLSSDPTPAPHQERRIPTDVPKYDQMPLKDLQNAVREDQLLWEQPYVMHLLFPCLQREEKSETQDDQLLFESWKLLLFFIGGICLEKGRTRPSLGQDFVGRGHYCSRMGSDCVLITCALKSAASFPMFQRGGDYDWVVKEFWTWLRIQTDMLDEAHRICRKNAYLNHWNEAAKELHLSEVNFDENTLIKGFQHDL